MNKLHYHFRLLFTSDNDKELFVFVYNTLGFCPKNLNIYKQSFTHKSVAKGSIKECNERLEFLGDAILGSVVADYLYDNFPKENEGFLSNLRSNIVNRQSMNKIGLELQFQRNLHAQIPNLSRNDAIGNCLEAFIGAIYEDLGYKKAKEFIIKKIILPHINEKKNLRNNTESNYKSLLLQYCQRTKVNLEYKTEPILSGKTPMFHAEIYINGNKISEAKGKSKKIAEQAAAKIALNSKRSSYKKELEEKQNLTSSNSKEN
ncbi:MAG: ribonuclease III [Bacteroidales bacterium]|nr:ribonuclease III [Bacteroidales bacterium]